MTVTAPEQCDVTGLFIDINVQQTEPGVYCSWDGHWLGHQGWLVDAKIGRK